jgi:hypothetical protein
MRRFTSANEGVLSEQAEALASGALRTRTIESTGCRSDEVGSVGTAEAVSLKI